MVSKNLTTTKLHENCFCLPASLYIQNTVSPKLLELETDILRECSRPPTCHVPCVMCHVRHVMCQMLHSCLFIVVTFGTKGLRALMETIQLVNLINSILSHNTKGGCHNFPYMDHKSIWH